MNNIYPGCRYCQKRSTCSIKKETLVQANYRVKGEPHAINYQVCDEYERDEQEAMFAEMAAATEVQDNHLQVQKNVHVR